MKVNHFTAGRPGSFLGGALVLSLCIAAVLTGRSAISLREAANARSTGDRPREVVALDRALLEAPPWALPIRRAARTRLEMLAMDDDPSAWYASLALVSASRGADRVRWQGRCLQLAGGTGPRFPVVDAGCAPPSPWLSGLSAAALIGWIGLAAGAIAGGGHVRRRLVRAAAACWLLWLVTLVAA